MYTESEYTYRTIKGGALRLELIQEVNGEIRGIYQL